MLNTRIRETLDNAQPVDQAGFRKGFACDDHLFTVVALIEKMTEFNCPIWICAIDFRKAFDTVEHLSLWESLFEQGVPVTYIHLMATLYKGQSGRVCADKTSKAFSIGRGTKQGDPLSPTLFNAVLEKALKNVVEKWKGRGWGVRLGSYPGDVLCNLRFADDILLQATNRR